MYKLSTKFCWFDDSKMIVKMFFINGMPFTFDGKKYFPGGGSTSISFGGAGGYPADTFSMDNTAGGGAHENRPPYYALCYIMKT